MATTKTTEANEWVSTQRADLSARKDMRWQQFHRIAGGLHLTVNPAQPFISHSEQHVDSHCSLPDTAKYQAQDLRVPQMLAKLGIGVATVQAATLSHTPVEKDKEVLTPV